MIRYEPYYHDDMVAAEDGRYVAYEDAATEIDRQCQRAHFAEAERDEYVRECFRLKHVVQQFYENRGLDVPPIH